MQLLTSKLKACQRIKRRGLAHRLTRFSLCSVIREVIVMVVGSATMGLFDALSKWVDGPVDSGPVDDARPVGTKE